MPHEPLTGDALLDALSEVPGDPAEPVPAQTLLADLRDHLPDDPWSAQYQGQSVPDPGQALDGAAQRSVEWRKVTSLLSGLRDRHWNDDFSARPLSEPTPEQRQAERDAEFDRRHVHDASDPYTHHYFDVVLSIPSHKQTDPPPKSEALIESPRVITWDPVPLAITSWRVFINPTEEENPE